MGVEKKVSTEELPEDAKKVDEDWKTQIERERSGLVGQRRVPEGNVRSEEKKAPSADFGFFLSSLSMQALIALGEVPHPQSNSRQTDLEQARYLIDILGMLQAKTKGNLEPGEEQALEGILYELRTKYVVKAGGP